MKKPATPTVEPEGKGSETRERILTAAEDLLRRHGLAKTTVVDVARALEMSHANVYRHFASKTELQDAVAQRWLHRIMEPLRAIVAEDGSAAERLERWVMTLAAQKRAKVLNDPELFAAYHAVAQAARAVVEAHIDELLDNVAAIIRDGVERGEFKVADPRAAATAVLNATSRFHHPYHVKESGGRDTSDEIRDVFKLVLAGLRSGTL
ncbi:TetR family transcriptional regulator [Dongia sedimenti]|uniref:TetR family transcriptional regulator n=1 Tax=Dongia sedimenti TaxID=3064282 RepID=A0ABU0YNK0_9PROT|nr:TetR family transcriptional regulator [Rhodospirillaceae bacterium R-7]